MKFIIIYDQRSGSTLLSKLITEKFIASVLPESNFIMNIIKYSSNKNVLYQRLISEKKFKNFQINKKKLRKIVNLNFLNKQKLIDILVKEANKNIYKKNIITIGTKLNQIDYLDKLSSIYKQKLKIIFIIRDVRDIFLSKKKIHNENVARGHKFSSSIIYNSYYWLKIITAMDKRKNVLTIRYEDLIEKKSEILKVKKFLKIKERKRKINFFLPKEDFSIHPNLVKKINFKNKKKYEKNLNFFEKIFFEICCHSMLYKYNFSKKNYIFFLISTIFLIFVRLKIFLNTNKY